MPVKIIIVEDEAILAESCKRMLTGFGYDVTGIALNKNAAEQLFRKTEFDLAILDINMGARYDGIELAHLLNTDYKKPFIFLTSYVDQVTIEKAKITQPLAYLLKPFTKDDLYTGIEIALAARTKKEEEYVLIKDGHLLIKVFLNDILFMKSDNIYVEVFTSDKTYLQRTSLDQFLSQLPQNKFLRTHRSYAVNISKVKALNGQYLVIGKELIPVSRNHIDLVRKHFGS
ncbi:MAG: LytTR family transcriptional regulator DNA-binding domain-containing protein [Bacteroidetes bacterium]|nr:LytTR family transcriptional regulator DNA-binding domain-containing protein [Bacteroidota bacterium]